MIYPRKARAEIITALTNVTTGLNARITAINTADNLACPLALEIHTGVQTMQYPEVFVDYGNNTNFDTNLIDDDVPVDTISYTLPLLIWCYLKSADENLEDWREIYGEAVTNCLNNWVSPTGNRALITGYDRSPTPNERNGEIESIMIISVNVLINRPY